MQPRYDLIGDVHGCASELDTLLEKLGWAGVTHPEATVSWSSWRYVWPSGAAAAKNHVS